MIQKCPIRREMAKKLDFFEILEVLKAKTKGFLKKNKLVSNDSELSNSMRNGKQKFASRRRFSALPPPFLQISVWQHSILRIRRKKLDH